MLPVLDDGRFVMVEQYRIPTRRWTLEIPSGHAKDGGDPVDAAADAPPQGRPSGRRDDAGVPFINDPSDPTRYTTIFQAGGLHEVERLKEDAADPANSYGWHGNTKGRPRAATVQSLPFSVPNAPSDAGPVRAGLPSPSAAPFHGRTAWSMMVSVPPNRSPGSATATTIWSPA